MSKLLTDEQLEINLDQYGEATILVECNDEVILNVTYPTPVIFDLVDAFQKIQKHCEYQQYAIIVNNEYVRKLLWE